MSASTRLQPCLRKQFPRVGYTRVASRFIATATEPPNQTLPIEPLKATRFPIAELSYHWDTIPPTSAQLSHASKFFNKEEPKFIWSAEKFKTMDFGDGAPEVCFLGRSNVGKSSILNALLGKRIAHTSSKPGRTRLMNAFTVGGQTGDGKNRLVVMDMPGYGKGGRSEWGTQIIKYFEKRRELKRAFLLVDAEHGLKLSDIQLIGLLKTHAVPYQVVLSKADKIIFDGNRNPSPEVLEARLADLKKTMEIIKDTVQPNSEDDGGAIGEVIACSSMKWVHGEKMNINAVRFAMLHAAGLEYRPIINTEKPVDIVPHEEVFGF